jgi:2-aminoadipate transaminase
MRLAQRMEGVPRSYIREILKVTAQPDIISFAGGLPHPASFPVDAVARAAAAVLEEAGPEALQYTTTEGFPPLRQWIADRYKRQGIEVSPDDILITTGSQQALDLVAKACIDRGGRVVMERPGYLGAIQCFAVFGPDFVTVPLTPRGVDTDALRQAARGAQVFYAVPSFQNPSGITYDEQTRREVADIMAETGCLLVEDNPYGELRFMGRHLPPVRAYMHAPSVLLGSFSKVVSPGLRLGWVCAPQDVLNPMITAKQASDLHTPGFTQRILHRYLADNDVDAHIASIRARYGAQRDSMVQAIRRHFPEEVACTEPEGGMFLWCTLPAGLSAEALFHKAIERKVAFVPGRPFYVDDTDDTFRLNFSNSSPELIDEGIARLGQCLREYLGGAA